MQPSPQGLPDLQTRQQFLGAGMDVSVEAAVVVSVEVSVTQPVAVQLRLIFDSVPSLVIRYLPAVTSMRMVPCATMGVGAGSLQSGLPVSV